MMLLGVNFQNIFLYLNDFTVNQYKFKHPVFNKIIESYEDVGVIKDTQKVAVANSGNSSVNFKNGGKISVKDVIHSFQDKKGALYIEFENNPQNELPFQTTQ
jgi:hypothetical protein